MVRFGLVWIGLDLIGLGVIVSGWLELNLIRLVGSGGMGLKCIGLDWV